jgi:hypothetical protein
VHEQLSFRTDAVLASVGIWPALIINLLFCTF